MSTAVLVITTPKGDIASEALPRDPAYAVRILIDLAVFFPNATWEVRCADGPVCQDCGEATEYQRGTNSRGTGLSTWVHTATGRAQCADGRGYARRPAHRDEVSS